MDLHKAISELYEEKKRLDQLIESLESQVKRLPPTTRRGRKSMSKEERVLVSERMRKYWQAKRGEEDAPPEEQDTQIKVRTAGEG